MPVPHQSETAPDETAFADLFDGMQDPALILDGESGRIRAANHAACTLLDYPRETLTAMAAADIHPHELPRLAQYLAEVRARGAWIRDDLSCRTRVGVFVPAEMRSTAFRAAGRDEILVILRDLRGEQLAEVGQSVRKLVHDLRNTLATAQLLSDRLQGHGDPEVRAGADVMSRSLERALDLCQQTLRAGRSEEHHPHRTRFLLDDIVEEVQTVNGTIQEISNATDEQAKTTQEVVRMVDEDGTVQTDEETGPYPTGPSGWVSREFQR